MDTIDDDNAMKPSPDDPSGSLKDGPITRALLKFPYTFEEYTRDLYGMTYYGQRSASGRFNDWTPSPTEDDWEPDGGEESGDDQEESGQDVPHPLNPIMMDRYFADKHKGDLFMGCINYLAFHLVTSTIRAHAEYLKRHSLLITEPHGVRWCETVPRRVLEVPRILVDGDVVFEPVALQRAFELAAEDMIRDLMDDKGRN